MKRDGINTGEISVVVSTYDDPINFVVQCINSLLPQEKVYELIIIDSSKKDEIKKLCHSLNNNKINYIYTPPKGLSDARNKGVLVAKRSIVAFTDSDCIPDKNWAENIYLPFEIAEDIAIVGGKVLPRWISKPNSVLYKSAIAQGFYSSFDMGEELKEVHQIFGGNFAINKNLPIDQFFSSELGRGKGNLLGGEETQLCKYVERNKLKIIYNPLAIVIHQIPEERSKLKWMWKRMYYGGINRAIVGGKPTPKTVNFISYNLYDVLFLIIFIVPYIYGLLNGLKLSLSRH
jgi:glycosyltransferase involved in cell wall biosynthesis